MFLQFSSKWRENGRQRRSTFRTIRDSLAPSVLTWKLLSVASTLTIWLPSRQSRSPKLFRVAATGCIRLRHAVLRDLGWTASAHGLVGPSENLSCQIGSNINYLDSVLHRIRVAWREKKCHAWLNSKRRDSAIARSIGVLRVQEKQVEEIRKLVKKHNVRFLAIVTGGMYSPAVNFERIKKIASCFQLLLL